MLKDRFLNFIEEQNLFKTNDKILIALSGGIDSVVMLNLFVQSKFQISVAHCNFNLRGKESDGDALFVKKLSEKYALTYFEKQFDTLDFAEKNKISTQMSARKLRYDWFEEIRQKHDFQYIAIAHNKNDLAETFLINLTRGTGINGLTGIKTKINFIIRPLLFASRDEIINYQKEHQLLFREDSSNASTKYIRNKIRHDIIPQFENINPNFLQTITNNTEHLQDTALIYENWILEKKEKIFFSQKDAFFLKKEEIKKIKHQRILIYELLKPYFFNKATSDKILQSLEFIGKQFFSKKYRLIVDREYLILSKIQKQEFKKIFIEKTAKNLKNPIHLDFQIIKKDDNFILEKENDLAFLDLEKLDFPLILRKWEKGDFFYPIGMKGKKKLSDFFTDNKFSIMEKEQVYLLTSSKNEIIWIIGHRLDNRFKIEKQTQEIFRVKNIFI